MPEERRVDILDYLYEELPPEQMASAREAIQADPNRLEEMRAIKETVLAYRALPRPVPPAGLAARAAAALNKSAPNPAGGSGASVDAIKSEVERELAARRRRSWFFHPGWAVAAGVILVFAALLHVSPRRAPGPVRPAPSGIAGTPSQAVPAGQPAAPAVPAQKMKTSPAARDAAEPLPEVGQRYDAMRQAGSPHPASLSIANTLVSEEPAPAPESLSAPPPPGAHEFIVPAAPLSDAASLREAAREGGSRAQSNPDGAFGATPEEILDAVGDSAGGDVHIVDLLRGREPPPLIELSEPIDKDALIKNLVFLIGLHMGEKEFAEARAAITLLRRYDPVKAGAMAMTLLKMEDAAEQAGEAVAAGMPSPAAAQAEDAQPNQAAHQAPEAAEPAVEPQSAGTPAVLPADSENADSIDAVPMRGSAGRIAPEPAFSPPVSGEEVILEAVPPTRADPPGIMGPSIPWPPPLVLHPPQPAASPPVAEPPRPPGQAVPRPGLRRQPPRLLWENSR